jgi:hypothetical protein
MNREKRAIHTARTSQNPGRAAPTPDAGAPLRRQALPAAPPCGASMRPGLVALGYVACALNAPRLPASANSPPRPTERARPSWVSDLHGIDLAELGVEVGAACAHLEGAAAAKEQCGEHDERQGGVDDAGAGGEEVELVDDQPGDQCQRERGQGGADPHFPR